MKLFVFIAFLVAGVSPVRAEERPRNASPVDCEARRTEMQRHTQKLLGIKLAPGDKPVNFKDEAVRAKLLRRYCLINILAPANARQGKACETSYFKIVDTVAEADQLVGQGCDALKEAGTQIGACKKGEAPCFKAAAAQFKVADGHLMAASKLLSESAKQMRTLRARNRGLAYHYAGHLNLIATKIRRLVKQGHVLDVNSPELEAALGDSAQLYEGKPVKELMNIYGIESLEPEIFDSKAEGIIREIGYLDEGKPAGTDITGAFASQQLQAATSVQETITFSNQEVTRLNETSRIVREEASRLETLSASLGSVPGAGRDSDRPTSPTPNTGTPPETVTNRLASLPPAASALSNASSASRALSSSQGASPPARAIAAPNFAPSPAASTRTSPKAAAKTGNIPVEKTAKAEKDEPSEKSESENKPETASIPSPAAKPEAHAIHDTLVQALRSFSPPSPPRAERAPASTILVNQSNSLETSPNAPSQVASKKPANVEEIVDQRMALIERSQRLSPSLRELVRQRLKRSLLKNENSVSEAVLLAGSEHGAGNGMPVISNSGEAPNEIAFSLNSIETEAEIKKILSGIQEEDAASGIMGTQSLSLFERIHGTLVRKMATQSGL